MVPILHPPHTVPLKCLPRWRPCCRSPQPDPQAALAERLNLLWLPWFIYPRHSIYATSAYIDPPNHPNVGIYGNMECLGIGVDLWPLRTTPFAVTANKMCLAGHRGDEQMHFYNRVLLRRTLTHLLRVFLGSFSTSMAAFLPGKLALQLTINDCLILMNGPIPRPPVVPENLGRPGVDARSAPVLANRFGGLEV